MGQNNPKWHGPNYQKWVKNGSEMDQEWTRNGTRLPEKVQEKFRNDQITRSGSEMGTDYGPELGSDYQG